jgi:hypothetical protein
VAAVQAEDAVRTARTVSYLTGETTSTHDELSSKDSPGAAVTKVEKVHLEWQQLCCTYNAAGGKIVVLDNIWGQATPGEMQVRPMATIAVDFPQQQLVSMLHAACCMQDSWVVDIAANPTVVADWHLAGTMVQR